MGQKICRPAADDLFRVSLVKNTAGVSGQAVKDPIIDFPAIPAWFRSYGNAALRTGTGDDAGGHTDKHRHSQQNGDQLLYMSSASIQSSVSLRTSAHTGVAVPRIFRLFFELFTANKGSY